MASDFDAVVVNDDVDAAVDEVAAILMSRRIGAVMRFPVGLSEFRIASSTELELPTWPSDAPRS